MSIPSLPAQGSTAWYPWAQALHNAASSAVQASDLGSGNANDAAFRAALGHPVSTDGTNGLPAPSGVGLEFVITATGLDDIRFNGTSL